MKKDFLAAYSIACPHCQVKQTGIVRAYKIETGEQIDFEDNLREGVCPIDYPNEQFAIKCSWSKCAQLITGDQLDEVTRKGVKSPSEINPNRW